VKLLFGVLTLLLFFEKSAAQMQRLSDKLDSLYLTGDYSQGEQLVRSALSTSLTNDTTRAWLDLQLGIFSQELGKYADAEEAYLSSEKIYAASLTNDHPLVASALSRLSVLYSEQGRFSEAKRAAGKQFGIYSRAFGKDDPYTALASIILALQFSNSGQPDSGKILLDEYQPIILQKFGAKSKEASRLYEAEGRVALAKKEYKKAEEYFIIARQTAQNTPGDKHPLTARIALALARTRLLLGNTDSASVNINDALAVALRASGLSHPFTAECFMTKGSIEEVIGKIPNAFESYKKALTIYKAATKENFRYTSERERLAFIRHVNEGLSRVASTSLRTSAFYPKGIGVFYDGLLFQKGIVLSSLQAMRRTALQSGDTTLGKLLDKLAAIRTRISRLASGQAKIEKPFINQDSLADIANDLEKELARHSLAFRDLQALNSLSWNDIGHHISTENICIEISRFPYYDGERRTDTAFYAALILRQSDSTNPHLALIGTAGHLEDTSLVRQYFRTLEKHPKKKNAALISQLLWSPIEPYILDANTINIAPDGIYHELSLPALSADDGTPLLEKYTVSTLASTSDILKSAPADSERTIDIFADPDYADGELEPLPGTLKEAQEIETSFSAADWKVKEFMRSDASEKNLESIHHPRILHIATHGKFSAQKGDDPERIENSLLGSVLYFSGANTTLANGSADPANDGILTALEAMDLDLEGTDLVTLSACESGKGVIEPGEGAFGLARAIRTAGARNILMSLWQIPDRETKELMSNFYKNLLQNQTKSASLRNAQISEREIIRKRYGEDIPYFWAAFVLIGF
jgi:CHAT domain-containing protein